MRRLICVILLLACLGLTVNANPNMQADIGNINIPMSAPMVDGNINTNEGWSEGVYAYKDLMATFGNTNDILQSFYLYYAYDKDGLYYAADILDSSFVLSTGEDDIDNVQNDFNIKNEVVYGYNGDIFTFTVDPLGRFLNEGYLSNTDYNAWYSVGIFEGDICRMFRGHNRSGDITADVKVSGQVTDAGWRFEAFIPWDFICQDAEEMSFGDITVTPAELYAGGAQHRAMAIYMDRFVDPESGDVDTFQRFATCGHVLADGLMGYLSSGVCLKAYGITLTIEGNGETTETTAATDTSTAETEKKSTDTKGETVTTQKATAKTTTKKAATGSTVGGNAAQTFDMGIAVAIGGIVIAVIAFVFVKKKL
ncbi:MAG: hypothetical protein IJB57_05705 [Clostridia bacterium]|nr:hypothetical protein [Clostridia bacterium]